MALLFNRAKMTTATTGTGTITLGSAVDGFQSFAAAGVTDGITVPYVIEDGAAWEIGTGVYTTSGTTLARTVTESSNADSAISLSGSAEVFISLTKAEYDAKAALASPALTGTPTAPTAALATDTTQIATTAFVLANSGGAAVVEEFTASGTFTKPASGTYAIVECWGAGGGGGGGAVYTAGAIGGGAGGGGGAYNVRRVLLSDLSATETVTIGAGGTGGTAVTGSDIDGNNGTVGGNTTFGSLLIAYGGGKGDGGDTQALVRSGPGGSPFNLSASGGAGDHSLHGGNGLAENNTAENFSLVGGGAGAAWFVVAGGSVYGGAGGGVGLSETLTNTALRPGGSSVFNGWVGGDGGTSVTDTGGGVDGTVGGIASGGGGGGNIFSTGGSYTSSVGGDGGDGFCRVTVY